jgi:cellulose biosynthesis protein BcsQ
MRYAFWNSKGGTGKTSLAFQAICCYAERHPNKKILAIDLCPQADLSELFLGGMSNGGSQNLLSVQGKLPRCTIGGYFQTRLLSPYDVSEFNAHDFITTPFTLNRSIPTNVDLVCGDFLLELLMGTMSKLSNAQSPRRSWMLITDWVRELVLPVEGLYDAIFIDCDTSFSIYTQSGLAAVERLILPVLAQDTSRRAVQNAFSLVYGLSLPSAPFDTIPFAKKLEEEERELPQVHTIVRNQLTGYMGPGSAYFSAFQAIDADLDKLLTSNPRYFTFDRMADAIVGVRDFRAAGVVASSRGCPFSRLDTGKQSVGGHRVQVTSESRTEALKDINALVNKL